MTAWSLHAQFSPGDLASSHKQLEGIQQCTQCHDLGKKIDDARCLDCHTLIKTRIANNKGFHGSTETKNKACIECHHDHLGRDYAMIQWKPSREKFDHKQTGYILEGKHQKTQCEVCHKEAFIKDNAVRARTGDGLLLNKTFLGLSQDCRSCHFDEHRDQFDQCLNCHDFNDWKKSSDKIFDHNKSKYPLTGLHTKVSCEKCHTSVSDPRQKADHKTDEAYFKYRPLQFANCTPCHADPHQNRFGQDCQKCHLTVSWKQIKNALFDHRQTRYPLEGLHITVRCEKCHQPDTKKAAVYKNMNFSNCTDCHTDAHAGQLTQRSDQGHCETCHDVNGFRPSRFTISRHATESSYPLIGAHEKTDCNKCHIKANASEFLLRTGIRPRVDSAHVILKFKEKTCQSCHIDIHRGQFADKLKSNDCDICHKTTIWKDIVFDHQKNSDFKLIGKHEKTPCEKCHLLVDVGTEIKRTLYKPIPTYCEHCHNDIHEGQFAEYKTMTPSHPKTDCAKCHSNDAFKPAIFDHEKQSQFPLTGAHIKVECAKCHIRARITSDTLNVVYKPISTECAACHPDQHEGVFQQR